MLKRDYTKFHHISVKLLHRYMAELAGRHNIRGKNTIDQMRSLVASIVGKAVYTR